MEFTPQTSLVSQITDHLTNAIIEGQFEGGQRLVENELQQRFGISRGPIRESFRLLEKDGLVVNIPRKGTYVRNVTKKDVEENFPIRAYLEGYAARLAVSHLDPSDVDGMKIAFSRMKEELKRKRFKLYIKHHAVFHEIFIYGSKNDMLIAILETLRRQAVWFRLSYLATAYVREFIEYVTEIHREILDCFVEGDADKAEFLVKEHILVASERFLKFCER